MARQGDQDEIRTETQRIAESGRASRNRPQEESSPTQDSYLGIALNGRYLIEKELGRGGFGRVYLACDKHLHSRPVVVKVLNREADQDGWIRKKFRQEIEALSRIDHPGVVGALDFGQMPDGKPYLVMQFVEGVPLRSVLKPEGMDLERVAGIVRQVSQALGAAHDKGIYHRDLKPENIMLQMDGDEERVRLIDFGVAKVKNSEVGESTDVPILAGSLNYMSPEQIKQEDASAASDIYALGVIAYEMITGRRPFIPESKTSIPAFLTQLLEQQQAGIKVRPKDLRPGLPEAAERPILKALSFNPAERYQQARDFGEELARALTSSQFDERTLEKKIAITDQKDASRVKRTGALILLGVLLAAIGLLAWPSLRAKREQLPSSSVAPVQASERLLSYSVMVQKFRNGKPYQEPFKLSHEVLFERDYRVRLNFASPQSGYLYIINESPVKTDGAPLYNLLFPSPTTNSGTALLDAGRQIQVPQQNWFVFDREEGTEKIWLIWSVGSVPELEAVKQWANPVDKGEIKDLAQISSVQRFLKAYSAARPEQNTDEEKRETLLRAGGDILIYLLKLEHH
jgi:serine/threonine protein kinase